MTDTDSTDWRRLLTRGERARMLEDIARVSLAAGAALFPGQSWQDLDIAAHSLTAHKSPVERLGFIERALPVLARTVRQIRQFPTVTALHQTRTVTPPVRARRVETQALLQAVRRGTAARSLDETVTVPTMDTPENRAVKSFAEMLTRDCAAIGRLAGAEGEVEAAIRAERCANGALGLLADPWWDEVIAGRGAWTKPPTQRAMTQPGYAEVFREIARYRAGFCFDWDQPLFALPPRETWRLYETWCLFTTLGALLTGGWTATATGDLFALREGRLTFTLAQGLPARVSLCDASGRRLDLVYNEIYAQGERSRSHTMQPDITLLMDGADGTTVWILDAKFKPYALPGEEGEDINQMHAYRDGIIGAEGNPCVAQAWCLYAGLAGTPNRSQITYSQTQTIVGALCLRPGSDESFRNLCSLLASWLGKEAPPESL